MWLVTQLVGELLNGGGGRNGKDIGARRHYFAHGLIAELDHGLDELAVAFLQDAFFFRGFNQRVHGFGWMFRLFRLMRLRQSGNGQPEAKGDGDRQHEINQALQQRNKFDEPHAARAREEHVRQKPVAKNDDQNNADERLNNFRPDPVGVSKDEIADNERRWSP